MSYFKKSKQRRCEVIATLVPRRLMSRPVLMTSVKSTFKVWYFTVVAIFKVAFFVVVRVTRDQSISQRALRLFRALCLVLRNNAIVTFHVLLSVYVLQQRLANPMRVYHRNRLCVMHRHIKS